MRLKALVHDLTRRLGFHVERVRPCPDYAGAASRHAYQRRYFDFALRPGDRVLDLGSGSDPLPEATVLVDRFIEPTHHRHTRLERAGKPLVLADIHQLPFADQTFDFVYCAHVLEHVDDPLRACGELMRIGRRGFVETPTLAKDLLFARANGMHRWHVQAIGATLVFFEYTPRLAEGIRDPAWRRLIFSADYHPLQQAFYANQDVFNTMLAWQDGFDVVVFDRHGKMRVRAANPGAGANRETADSCRLAA
jgi:SAM-dependent methyltransferase